MWSDGVNVQVVVYNGPNLVMVSALMLHLEKSIELKTHIPFPEDVEYGKYVLPMAIEKVDLPNGNYQVIMKGVVREAGR